MSSSLLSADPASVIATVDRLVNRFERMPPRAHSRAAADVGRSSRTNAEADPPVPPVSLLPTQRLPRQCRGVGDDGETEVFEVTGNLALVVVYMLTHRRPAGDEYRHLPRAERGQCDPSSGVGDDDVCRLDRGRQVQRLAGSRGP